MKTTVMRKVPQDHGGALNAGGTPGNRGGAGRPSAGVRAAFLDALEHGPARLKAIIDAPESRDADKIAAILAAARIGLASQVEVMQPEPLTPTERAERVAALLGCRDRSARE